MAHGSPDWTELRPTEVIYTIEDMGELAVRLNSIDSYNRGGNVLFIDGFENGIGGYYLIVTGTGGVAALSTLYTRNGSFAVKLTNGTTLGRQASITKAVAYPVLSKIGFEFSFSIDSSPPEIYFDLATYDAVNSYRGEIDIYPETTSVNLMKSDGSFITIDDKVGLMNVLYGFNTVKLVIDFVNKIYVRLIINNQAYDLSEYGLYNVLSGAKARLQSRVITDYSGGANRTAYIDDWILTRNES